MKRQVNRNYLWSKVFVDQLAYLGVENVCISPGSRSTPLTLAFARNKKIKSYVIIDERSSGFFALGLAKNSKKPVVIVTTSGTAVAELYPAVIEAYQQRVPLIICTADRPPEMLNSGANQTINQNNIYANHINWFFDLGLPEVSKKRLEHLKSICLRAFVISQTVNKGPVHLNFPFRKPFEPDAFTDDVEEDFLENALTNFNDNILNEQDLYDFRLSESVISKIYSSKKIIFSCGQGDYSDDFASTLAKISSLFNIPVFADGATSLRYSTENKENIISNFAAILKSDHFLNELDPDLIIHFGNAPTSKTALDFFSNSKARKILINKFGDWKDPSQTAKSLIPVDPSFFCNYLIENIDADLISNEDYLHQIKDLEFSVEELKNEIIEKAEFPFEGRIVIEIIKNIPASSNLMVSNSLPIRDLDSFAPMTDKGIHVFSNRGASGIDGITSTAAGIAAASGNHTFLITGDLAFFHDLNGLLAIKHYKIPLTVILVNNNGGGIFEMLPVAEQKEHPDYFITPLNLEFEKIVDAYEGTFIEIKNWYNLKEKLVENKLDSGLRILEIRTDSKKSLKIRKLFWNESVKKVEARMNESSII